MLVLILGKYFEITFSRQQNPTESDESDNSKSIKISLSTNAHARNTISSICEERNANVKAFVGMSKKNRSAYTFHSVFTA